MTPNRVATRAATSEGKNRVNAGAAAHPGSPGSGPICRGSGFGCSSSHPADGLKAESGSSGWIRRRRYYMSSSAILSSPRGSRDLRRGAYLIALDHLEPLLKIP